MGKIHKVIKGESVASLADATGHFPGTIWYHPENNKLRQLRDNMNILAEDDNVYIPELGFKAVPSATGLRHRFRRCGVPAIYRLQLLINGQPRKNLNYRMEVEGLVIEDSTDDNGIIEVFVPPSTREIRLFVGSEETPRILEIGMLDPSDTIAGMQQRLRNLGYDCPESGTLDENTRTALRSFQSDSEMIATGDPDTATISTLRRAHDEIGETK
jgi:hypothetical protein